MDMDKRHRFKHEGIGYVVNPRGPVVHYDAEAPLPRPIVIRALAAETLRLAEEVEGLQADVRARDRERLRLGTQVAEQARTIDRLKDDARLSRDVAEAALRDRRAAVSLGHQLIEILSRHVGERGASEGAVETLERIIAERDQMAAKARRRKAKIRKLREERDELRRPWVLSSAKVTALRESAIAEDLLGPDEQLEFQERGGNTFAYARGRFVFRVTAEPHETITDLLRMAYNSGMRHLTAPASQEPSPAGKSAPE